MEYSEKAKELTGRESACMSFTVVCLRASKVELPMAAVSLLGNHGT